MDNLKTLMDRKQYELVLKITEQATDPDSLFYRISAFLATGKGDEALNVINLNHKILETRLPTLMRIHIELLCLLGRFDEAYKKVDYYQELPYFSQEAEELLKKLPEVVREEEKKALYVKPLSDDELKFKLKSDKQEDVLPALDALRDRDLKPFYPAIQKVMLDFPKQAIRSFALLLLVQKEVNVQFSFNHLGEIIKVNPSKTEAPFVGDDFNELVRQFGTVIKDPTISNNAVQMLSSYIIYNYPEKISLNTNYLIRAFEFIACEYLQIENRKDINQICEEYGLDKNTFTDFVQQIESALDDF